MIARSIQYASSEFLAAKPMANNLFPFARSHNKRQDQYFGRPVGNFRE